MKEKESFFKKFKRKFWSETSYPLEIYAISLLFLLVFIGIVFRFGDNILVKILSKN
tara:strand:+ start:2197 stop:2364 length:168 start_codon:yes stop_codon:yes gene_type:complete